MPKYLNSPETAAYKKSSLLFGLHHARPALARGATPSPVEGPFDAIAPSPTSRPRPLARARPCGTALSRGKPPCISQAADLDRTGILVAFDNDTAGREATLPHHGILRPLDANSKQQSSTARTPPRSCNSTARPPCTPPCATAASPCPPCSSMPGSESWERRLDNPVRTGQYLAMLNVAVLIADLPAGRRTARQIRRITAGRELQTFDDQLHHVDNPELADTPASCPPTPPTRPCGPRPGLTRRIRRPPR